MLSTITCLWLPWSTLHSLLSDNYHDYIGVDDNKVIANVTLYMTTILQVTLDDKYITVYDNYVTLEDNEVTTMLL